MTVEPVIFLDIDGVLNDHTIHPRILYCTIEKAIALRLDRILVETDASIVLTSAWRYLVHDGSMRLDGLRYLLNSHWIDGDRLIGITRPDRSASLTDRGQQITEWLAEHGSRPYIVIDDMDLEITACGHPLVLTDGRNGLSDQDVEQAIGILRAASQGRTS